MKRKSCFINFISSFDKVASFMDEGKAIDETFLNFSKAFDTISQSIFQDDWLIMR